MSICIDSGTVLANTVGTSSSHQIDETTTSIHTSAVTNEQSDQQPVTGKNVTKLVVPTGASTTTAGAVLQKVVNQPLITVLNSSGPLTVVKSLCVTSGVSSAPQFTLVNSAPLSVANAAGKAPTITLLNTPVHVVKTIPAQNVEKTDAVVTTTPVTNNVSPPTVMDSRGHNVFVKNTCSDSNVPDMPQSHKLLTANNFPQANVLTNVQNKTANGQRNKLKILSNVQMMPGTSSVNNVLVNKQNNAQRYVPRTKLIGPNGATTKYLNKPNNVLKTNINPPPIKHVHDKSPQRMVYPTHKSQIKTLAPNYVAKPHGIKTLSPQQKPVPGHVQRNNSGLRTIPPQRPPKMANKPNYIGKHAVQAQKMRAGHHKVKGMKVAPNAASYGAFHGAPPPDKQLTFNQALTAEIIETLSNKSTAPNSYKHYEILPNRYDNAYTYQDHKQHGQEPQKPVPEDKSKSGLDALSLICQAVLLDHNYNATPPPDSPTRTAPPPIPQAQVNGMTGNSMYSPGAGKRRPLPSSNTVTNSSTMSGMTMGPSNSGSMLNVADDDAASDISDVSVRKHDTEGEETDTAPEAEAVNEETLEHYGDYVTRCICGFLHDDGYMVECDKCKVWQHVQCVVKNKQVPDEYLCEVCDPSKPIDKNKARMVQQQWLRDRQMLAESKLKKDVTKKETLKQQQQQREVLTDTDSSDGEHAHNNNVVTKRQLQSRRKSESKPPPSRTRRDSTKDMAQRRQKRRERKIVKRKVKPTKTSQSDDENQDSTPSAAATSVPPVSTSHLPQLRQWIEKYEEAVTNHYSPELRARISNIRVNGAHSEMPSHFDPTVHKCRVHSSPVCEMKYLVATVNLPPNTPIVELRGKYMLSTQHRNSGGSLTTRQHSQRPGPFLFFYRLQKDNTEVCVDTRTYGNSARFIRRSCRPNAELRHCIEKGVLHLYVVSIADVERNSELTIKHESHDLAVVGTTQIPCACGSPDDCTVNKTTVKKNGETPPDLTRKRRGRRTISTCVTNESEDKKSKEETPTVTEPVVDPIKPEPEDEKTDIKEDIKLEVADEPAPNVKEEHPVKNEVEEVKVKKEVKEEVDVEEEPKAKEEEIKSPPHTPIMTRRSSQYKSDKDDSRDGQDASTPTATATKPEKGKNKKLSREERKLEAILRAIEQMEKAEQRKQEHEAKAQHRRESEPGPNPKEEEKVETRMKRRRRKGRARTTSTNTRRNRLNSTDSYMTSGDETMLSPSDNARPSHPKEPKCTEPSTNNDKAVGLLLALSNGENSKNKSPTRDVDSNSNSAHSSPETQLSSACLLVQAAVEPLEQGFKFPKTKKGLMNEWLNKVPEPVQSASSISPSSLTPHMSSATEYENAGFYTPGKNLAALAQAASFCDNSPQHPRGSAKKRWLRQAISEDQSCDSPQSRPESPPLSETVAPPKKRRLPRESLSNEASPPSTPTSTVPPGINSFFQKLDDAKPSGGQQPQQPQQQQEGCVEIVYSGAEGDSPTQSLECDAVLKERAAQMKQEFQSRSAGGSPQQRQPAFTEAGAAKSIATPLHLDVTPTMGGCRLMDPRLAARENAHHPLFTNSEHLVGTVEKTLSMLGFEERRPEQITPAKRKLSITEYRQRKKLNNNEKNEEAEPEPEPTSTEENNSVESFRATRQRSGSTSSNTSITSSDDDVPPIEPLPGKALSAFNSEPTELERQREISSLRLKKVFGLALVDEARKPALDVEAILNCELPPVKTVKPPPSPTFPIPGSCEVTREAPTSPLPRTIYPLEIHQQQPSPPPHPPTPTPPPPQQSENEHVDAPVDEDMPEERNAVETVAEVTETMVVDEVVADEEEEDERPTAEHDVEPNMFYTPDEEEAETADVGPRAASKTVVAAGTVYDPSGQYVPAFNNPVYSNNKLHISSIDDDTRYEGRNPSPPPDLDPGCD